MYLTTKSQVTPPARSDLYFALGTFEVKSKAHVVATEVFPDGDVLIQFTRWVVSCSDMYNWHERLSTEIPLIGEIKDKEMLKLERVGIARKYPIEIKSFSPLGYYYNDRLSISIGPIH